MPQHTPAFSVKTPFIIKFGYCLLVLMIISASVFSGVKDSRRVIKNFFQSTAKTNHFRVVTENEVFALVGNKDSFNIDTVYRLPENDFMQEIILNGNNYFVTEVRDIKNVPLFIYGTNFKIEKSRQISEQRNFSVIDGVPYYYKLFANDEAIFREALSVYGINSQHMQLKKIKDKLYYLLGSEDKGLLMDNMFRPIYIKTEIIIDQTKVPYEIRFEEFHKNKKLFPIKTVHYLNGKKVMVTRAVTVDFNVYKTISRSKFFSIKS